MFVGIVNTHSIYWELEMMDAFIDKRNGFDLITGNPPWEKVKPYDDEFFTPYDVTFRSLKPKTKKYKRIKELLNDSVIKQIYESYKNNFKEKNAFYSTYEMQGIGDRDLWKLVLEKTSKLIAKKGVISMIIPSQILVNAGAIDMRKYLLDLNILSLYIFENKKKIFPIDSRYRFALLSVQNMNGHDEFPGGFYLHHLQSLYDDSKEKTKFHIISKKMIHKLSPNELIISEIGGLELEILEKIFQNDTLELGLAGWNIGLSRGFDRTNDADLFLENGKGWPVLGGKNIHHYIHNYTIAGFTTTKQIGLKRESSKRIFIGKYRDFYNSFKLVFRDTARSTDTRTVIATIVPPHTFHTCSLRSIILTQNNKILLDTNYNKKIAYLCGILDSLSFDFTARTRIQIGLAPIIKSLPIPKLDHEKRIAELAAKIMIGTPEFEAFAESFRIPNVQLTPAQRIETVAEIDALVAISYGLTKNEYKIIIDSFKLFRKNPTLYDLDEVIWDNNNLKEFYGEMSDLALQYFEAVIEN